MNCRLILLFVISFAALAGAAETADQNPMAEPLYEAHCAVCHDIGETGGRGFPDTPAVKVSRARDTDANSRPRWAGL